MDYDEKEKLSEDKKIFLFKWFIKFLEIYGQETFGESASINWGMVHREIIGHDIWSMNMELDNLLYNSDEDLDSEKFRDKVFSYIENQVIEGYPIFRLFNLPPKLNKFYEDEINKKIYEEDKKIFENHKCYRCKHFKDRLQVYVGNPDLVLEGTMTLELEYFKERYPQYDIKQQKLIHHRKCDLHSKYLEEFENDDSFVKSWTYKIRDFNRWIDKKGYAPGTKYPHNDRYDDDVEEYSSDYYLKVLSNKEKCNNFEPIEDYDFDKFLEKYIELQ